jgi:hypothetical protein
VKLIWPRLTIRRLMIAAAIAGILLGVNGLLQRRNRWRETWLRHQMAENSNLRLAKTRSEAAAQDETGAESHRSAAAAAHKDRTINEWH